MKTAFNSQADLFKELKDKLNKTNPCIFFRDDDKLFKKKNTRLFTDEEMAGIRGEERLEGMPDSDEFLFRQRIELSPDDYSVETGTIPGQKPLEGEIGGKPKVTIDLTKAEAFLKNLRNIVDNKDNPIEITGHVVEE